MKLMKGYMMTTKQQIIDYIHTRFDFYNDHDQVHLESLNHLEKMIKDLKPEIKVKVKKLPWIENNYKDKFFTPITKRFYIYKCLNMFKIEIDDIVYKEIFTFQEAQDYIQNLWDKYALSLVEVESD